ncbi:MAG: conjugative transposon protein TraJ [Taibaiella sp.]|nr:conjugative transposon protein TraJ [Taibaiella sp.]
MEWNNLHEVLRSLYDDMMPFVGDMASLSKGLAGLGALFYVSLKVWQALSRAEPIDVFPLLRPFALGLCIMFFPTFVLGTINTVLSPFVKGTHMMLEDQVLDLNVLQQQKDQLEYEAMIRNPETAFMVSDEEFDKKLDELGWMPSDISVMAGMYMDRAEYKIGKALKDWFRNLLEILFQAAALVIDSIRTFFLIVLSILGPIAFALSIWDGFQHTLGKWLARYISIYLWLPVSDLFSSMLARIQSLILEKDIEMLSDPTFIPDTSNTVYIIFMIIGIVGYFTIPTVTGWIIETGGAGHYIRNIHRTASMGANIAGGVSGSTVGNIGGKLMKK